MRPKQAGLKNAALASPACDVKALPIAAPRALGSIFKNWPIVVPVLLCPNAETHDMDNNNKMILIFLFNVFMLHRVI
jgi:hypothetical protein